MISFNDRSVSSICNSFFLSKGKDIYSGVVVSHRKKDIVLEFLNVNLLFSQSLFYLYNFQENRFWLYDDMKTFDDKNFNFCFKSCENFKKPVLFDSIKEKSRNYHSYVHYFNTRAVLVSRFGFNSIFKTRILKFVRGGYLLSFLGLKAFLKHPLKFRSSFFSYRYWFFFNLSSIGFLDSFIINRWNLSYSSRISSGNFFKLNKSSYLKPRFLVSLVDFRKI